MKRGKAASPKLEELRGLAHDPAAQAEFAATMLEPKAGLEAIRAALAVLLEHPVESARPGLVRLFDHFSANNGVRDGGAFTRSLIVRALRPVARSEDRDVLIRALTTYEFPPPAYKEEGALLRAVALTVLNDIDDSMAAYHATRLLADEHTDQMSGEPALTAAALLAAHEEWLPLYFYVMQAEAHQVPEVTAECLRRLVNLPEELVGHLVGHLGKSTKAAVLVGLFDLLVQHRNGPREVDFLIDYLRSCQDPNMYRYLATTLVASGEPELVDLLLEEARFTQQRMQVEILIDVLEVLPRRADVQEVMDKLRARLSASTRKTRGKV